MKKVLIDTDCGIDDAVAILMALACKYFEVVGITTVSGNVYVDKVNHNVLRLLSFLNREDIPVFRGASGPLSQKPVRAESIHGKDGLGGVFLPETHKTLEPQNAAEGIYLLAKQNPGLTIVALGPLTNIAMAVNLYPELNHLIGNIIAMGGAIDRGNVTRYAEFNFYADPESVQYVVNTPIPMEIIPWDPCAEHMFTEEEIKALIPENNRIGELFLSLQQLPFNFVEKYYGVRSTMLPDPFAMAYAIDETVALRKLVGDIRMELNCNTHRGESVQYEGDRLNIILKIDRIKFLNILKTILTL